MPQPRNYVVYVDLVGFKNLIAPIYLTLVDLPQSVPELDQLLKSWNYSKINTATLPKLKKMVKQLARYQAYFYHHTDFVSKAKLEQFSEQAIVNRIYYVCLLYKMSQADFTLDNLCWVRSLGFGLNLKRHYLYLSLKDEPALTTAEKIAFIYSRYFYLVQLREYNQAYPWLKLLNNKGIATQRHLVALGKLNNLPPFYLWHKTSWTWLKHFAPTKETQITLKTNLDIPLWIQKFLLNKLISTK